MELAKFLSLVWEKVLFYGEVIYFLINNRFGNAFQNTPIAKMVLVVFKLLQKVFSSLKVHGKLKTFIIFVLF